MAESVGSSFCRVFGVCQHSCAKIFTNYTNLTKAGNVEQELRLQNRFLYISGFSSETKVLSSSLYKMDPCFFLSFLYSKWQFCFNVCSCHVPHFVGASGFENRKECTQKKGLGALIL